MRDTRDPQQLGEALLSMSGEHGMSIIKAADILDGSWQPSEEPPAGVAEAAPAGPEDAAATAPPDPEIRRENGAQRGRPV